MSEGVSGAFERKVNDERSVLKLSGLCWAEIFFGLPMVTFQSLVT
jgi:hypothetical protein